MGNIYLWFQKSWVHLSLQKAAWYVQPESISKPGFKSSYTAHFHVVGFHDSLSLLKPPGRLTEGTDCSLCRVKDVREKISIDTHNHFIFFLHFFIVVWLQLSPFFPITLLHPTHPHLPHSILPLHCLYPWVLYACPWWPFHFFPLLLHSILPSCYWRLVLYFSVSHYILLACLFCWLSSTYRWDHMVCFFHHLPYFT